MSNDKLENMRSRLSITELDKDSRDDLFKKFQQGGGKVVDLENDVNKLKKLQTSKSSQKESDGITVNAESFNKNPFTDTKNVKVPIKTIKTEDLTNVKSQKESIFKFYLVRTSCFLANLFNFTATKFSKKFVTMTLEQAFQYNAYLKSCFGNIFNKAEKNSMAFREYIIQIGMIEEYEYVYRIYTLIDETDFHTLREIMPFSVDDSEEYLVRIYGKLLFFNQFSAKIKRAMENISEQYEEYFHKKIYKFYDNRKITQSLSFLWSVWFVWLEELMNYYLVRHNYKNNIVSMPQFLKLNTIPEIGTMSKKWIKELEDKKNINSKESENISNQSEYPDSNIELGMLFINKFVDFPSRHKLSQDTKDSRALLSVDDKLCYAYILVDFFDKEFSLVWNEINFYVDLGKEGRRFDPKKEIRSFNSKFSQFDEALTEYVRAYKFIKDGHFEDDIDKNRQLSKLSFGARQTLLGIFEQYTAVISNIFAHKDKENDTIGNWEEIIFSQKNQDHKLLYGYTVEQIINLVYGFTSSMVWLLKYKDLSGLDSNIIYEDVLTKIDV